MQHATHVACDTVCCMHHTPCIKSRNLKFLTSSINRVCMTGLTLVVPRGTGTSIYCRRLECLTLFKALKENHRYNSK